MERWLNSLNVFFENVGGVVVAVPALTLIVCVAIAVFFVLRKMVYTAVFICLFVLFSGLGLTSWSVNKLPNIGLPEISVPIVKFK